MKILLNCIFCMTIVIFAIGSANAQKACCAKGSKASIACQEKSKATKACCSSDKKLTTSGCTPSNCRGAKTKFGEAKVISNLRLELVALKAKMETHKKLKFSDDAISVHNIIGETDEQSMVIVEKHVALITSEVTSLSNVKLPEIVWSDNKAIKVKQLNERITALDNLL